MGRRARKPRRNSPRHSSRPRATDMIDRRYAEVNGTKLHYLVAGNGDPVFLLHGYAQTSHMWRPLIAELAQSHTVIAPDLRGFGESAKPQGGYDKKTMAQDVHALATSLGYKNIGIAGHDIGADGCLCVRRPVSERGKPDRVDGRISSWRRRLDQ